MYEMRCHVLDREDQIGSHRELLAWLESKTQGYLNEIECAKLNYEKHLNKIVEVKEFIEKLESTLHIPWINNPKDFVLPKE